MTKKSFLGAFFELAIFVTLATILQIAAIIIVLIDRHASWSLITALLLVVSMIFFVGVFYVLWRSVSPIFARERAPT